MNQQLISKFERWYAAPINLLKALPSGDGAFAAMSISLALFERYTKSDVIRSGGIGNTEAFLERAPQLTGVDKECFGKFWGMYRDGIQHYLQPRMFTSKGVRYGWVIGEQYEAMPYYFVNTIHEKIIAIDPWKWSEWVLDLYRNDHEVLEVLESHAFGNIYDFGMGKGGEVAEAFLMPMFLCQSK